MSTLAALQDAMQDWLLDGDPRIGAHIAGPENSQRLRIYADAYRLRLLDVLAQDFPVTRTLLGEAAFEAQALGYLQAHPSRQPSVRWFGNGFADWLAQAPGLPAGSDELARFEWLQGECFDAPDAPMLALAAVASLSAEAWPILPLRLHPAARMLATRHLRLSSGQPVPARRTTVARWLLWRSGLDVHWRRLDDDEAEVLGQIARGTHFGEVCESLARLDGDGSALRAASLLKRWLTDGVLAADPDPID